MFRSLTTKGAKMTDAPAPDPVRIQLAALADAARAYLVVSKTEAANPISIELAHSNLVSKLAVAPALAQLQTATASS